MYVVSFTVKGRGNIIGDMLRYDSCWPADQESAGALFMGDHPGSTRLPEREIRLTCYRPLKSGGPTAARWASFGWRVLPESVRSHKL